MPDESAPADGAQQGVNESLAQFMAMITTRLDASDAALAGLTLQMANCMDRLAGVEERCAWCRQLVNESTPSWVGTASTNH